MIIRAEVGLWGQYFANTQQNKKILKIQGGFQPPNSLWVRQCFYRMKGAEILSVSAKPPFIANANDELCTFCTGKDGSRKRNQNPHLSNPPLLS